MLWHEWADASVDDGIGRADDNNDKTRQRGRGDETIQQTEDAREALKDGRIAYKDSMDDADDDDAW